MIKKYKNICEKLKINYSSDVFLCSGILALTIIMSIILAILVSYKTIIIGVIVYLLFIYIHITLLNRKYKLLTLEKDKAFELICLTIINNLKINMPLIDSIKSSLSICDELLIDDVKELIINLESGQSLDAFFKFSENFIDDKIKTIIMYLSSLAFVEDYEYAIFHIEQLYQTFDNSINENLINEKSNLINKYRFIPIILSSLSVIVVFSYVFSSIGKLING